MTLDGWNFDTLFEIIRNANRSTIINDRGIKSFLFGELVFHLGLNEIKFMTEANMWFISHQLYGTKLIPRKLENITFQSLLSH